LIQRNGLTRDVLAAAQRTEMTRPSTMAPHESSMVMAAPSRSRPKLANTGANLKLYTRFRCLLCRCKGNGKASLRPGLKIDLTYFRCTVNDARDARASPAGSPSCINGARCVQAPTLRNFLRGGGHALQDSRAADRASRRSRRGARRLSRTAHSIRGPVSCGWNPRHRRTQVRSEEHTSEL